ncbi:hydrogenase [Candidatus Bathyarchaeota archaeon]|nr:MAG: hydrogenase [Candidatus Bathyarchaeota archaeon]
MEDSDLKLPKGKIPAETLKKTVFRHLGAERKEVLLGPSLGEDGSVVKIGEEILISAMDPITGTSERIGWLAVHINANDVATFGVQPTFFSSCILLPENSSGETVEEISRQIDEAAKDLDIAVIGGHSEVTPDLERPIIVGCAMGVTREGRYVTSGGSKPNDKLILTKGAGIEGTAILASEAYHQLKKKIDEHILESAVKFYDKISVVKDAILAFNVGGVNAMHDPTEGGVAGGIHEMADAANLGVKVFEDRIPMAKETVEICDFFNIDPLQLISSGALLISADPQSADEILKELRDNKIHAAIIGEFLENPKDRLLISAEGTIKKLIRPVSDHLWTALERCDVKI